MAQDNKKHPSLTALNQEEINAVSGGAGWLIPAIGAAIVKFVIDSILITIRDKNKDKNDPNNNDQNMCYVPCDSGKK